MRICPPRESATSSALPADHGPRNVPNTPRAAITARSNSVSKYSAARSATAIGPQRSSRNISFLPSLRIARPVFSMLHRSPLLGWSMSGGVVASASPMTLPILPSDCSKLGIFRRVFLRERRDLLRRLAGILIKRKRPPIGRKRGHANIRRDQPAARVSQVACRARCRGESGPPCAPASSSEIPDGIRR